MRPAAGVAVCAFVACWVGQSGRGEREAWADASQQVLLVVPADSVDALTGPRTRLAAELRTAGFDVVERSTDEIAELPSPDEKDATAPFATVFLHRADAGVLAEVRVSDHVTHRTVARQVATRGSDDAAGRALALRVVELMRASLFEGLPAAAGENEAPSLAETTAPAHDAMPPPRRSTPAFDISLGVAGAFVGPDLGFAVAPELRVAYRPVPSWSIAVVGAGPALGARVTASEGTATARQEFAVLEGAWEPFRAVPVRPYAVAGGGVYHLTTTGVANAPYTSGTADTWSALVEAGVGLRTPLSSAASLTLEARELLALPRPVVAFAASDVAAAMHPGTLVALSLAVSLR